jgi:hypothetical protein
MSLGTLRDRVEVSVGDTAELSSYIYNDKELAAKAEELADVVFTIRRPDAVTETIVGEIREDGSGFLRYTDTDVKGLYVWKAQFTYMNGEIRSKRNEFVVLDPLEIVPQTRASQIAEQVWLRLEDCFDSEEGGPWLRDMTLSYFDPEKIERFIPEGLLEINIWPPTTNVDLSYFTTMVADPDPALPPGTMQPDPDRIILVQGTLLAVIKHLMRSYVEQPNPVGANIVYQDRRDYLARWQTIYTLEENEWRRMVALWKRQFLNLGRSSLLVSSKAGRLGQGTSWRTRNIGRGMY